MQVFDIAPTACDALKAKGAKVCASQEEAARNVDFVVTMLPNNDIVSKTYETLVKDGLGKDTIYIDSSTIDPNVAKAVSTLYCNMVDLHENCPMKTLL